MPRSRVIMSTENVSKLIISWKLFTFFSSYSLSIQGMSSLIITHYSKRRAVEENPPLSTYFHEIATASNVRPITHRDINFEAYMAKGIKRFHLYLLFASTFLDPKAKRNQGLKLLGAVHIVRCKEGEGRGFAFAYSTS